MIHSFDFDLQVEKLEFLDLSHQKRIDTSHENDEATIEQTKSKQFLEAFEKILQNKEAKVSLSFDHLKKKKKRAEFENPSSPRILNDNQRLEDLEIYKKKKEDEKAEKEGKSRCESRKSHS